MSITPAITKLANILDSHVDFNLLANVLGNLDSITAAKLGQLATADLVTMTNDLAKGNYLGNRKLDIDLSLNIGSNGLAIYYRQVDIISVEGIRVSYPFYASGTTVISETSSPSQILTHIQDAITSYNAGESDVTLQILNTEFQLLNEVIVDKPTVIRIVDVNGKASNIARIDLTRNSSGIVDKYFWALTTSSLQTLSERIGDLLALGASITDIIALSSKQIEIEDIYTNRGALFNNTDSIYTEMNKLVTLYDNMTSLIAVNAGLANISTVGTNITNVNNVATSVVPNITTILDTPNQALAAKASATAASKSEANANTSAVIAADQASIATKKNQEIKAMIRVVREITLM